MSESPWNLRRWQSEAVPRALATIESGRKSIVSAVMGSGKSIVIAELAHACQSDDAIVLVTTPTQRLVEQLHDTIARRCSSVGMYYTHAKQPDRRVVVACNASAEALSDVLAHLDKPVALWIADEVHRSETSQIIKAHEVIQPRAAIGFTATPYRSRKREKLSLWDSIVYRYTLTDALNDRHLVPWKIIPWEGGGQSAKLDDVCLSMAKEHGAGPGVFNASSIADAEDFTQSLESAGWKAAVVHSRQPKNTNTDNIQRLESGDLDCLVHVNMLAEGVDFPWLRWMCLRRPVGARVRFIQEVGRVLRAAKGKDRAILMDPHDLFGTFGFCYEEAIGEWEKAQRRDPMMACAGCAWWSEETCSNPASPMYEEGVKAEDVCGEWAEIEEEEEEDSTERIGLPVEEKAATQVDPVTAYCRSIVYALQAAQWISSDKIASLDWRAMSTTHGANAYLQSMNIRDPWQWLPGEHSATIARIASSPTSARTGGTTSDLIEIAKCLTKRRAFPLKSHDIEPPAPRLLDAMAAGKAVFSDDDPKWYVAGVWKTDGKYVAFATFHGGRVVDTKVRSRRLGDGWGALQMEAMVMAIRSGARGPFVTDFKPAAMVAMRHWIPKNDGEREMLLSIPPGIDVEIVERGKNPAINFAFIAMSKAAPKQQRMF